jgi:hypothetical protein
MRVTYAIRRTHPVITLGRAERALWQTETADARDLDAARRSVRARVRALFAAGASVVNVYAPAKAGGYLVDQHIAEEHAARA